MSRRTLDTDSITLRQINVLTPKNGIIPALTTLTSDGEGGTFWAVPSSLGGIPSFNNIVVNNETIPATNPFNTLYISTLGIGTIVNSTTNLLTLYSKGFDSFDISGGNKIAAYSNSILSPTVNLVGRNGIQITGDPFTRTLFFDTQATAISTGIYGYSQMNFISNASTVSISAVNNSNNDFLTANSTSSIVNFIGTGDIVLKTYSNSNAVFLTISSFDSATYLNMSTLAMQTYGSTLSTVSSLFCGLETSGQGLSSLSTCIFAEISTLSTSISIRQGRNENNLMNNYTEINLYKVLSTSVASFINTSNSYVSSINTASAIGPFTGAGGGNLDVSPLGFRLDSMSSLMNQGSQITVSYSPSLLYSMTIAASEMPIMSTFIVAGNTTVAEGVFTRPWALGLTNPPVTAPYLYTDSMKFVLKFSNITPALTSSFNITHNLDLVNGGNTVEPTMSNLTSGTNGLIINIT